VREKTATKKKKNQKTNPAMFDIGGKKQKKYSNNASKEFAVSLQMDIGNNAN
jgi:hypothetical protein